MAKQGGGSRFNLWFVACGALLLVVFLQGRRIGESTDRIVALQAENSAVRSRVDASMVLLNASQASLAHLEGADLSQPTQGPGATLNAASLKHKIRILEKGDPDLLNPAGDEGIVEFFDELL